MAENSISWSSVSSQVWLHSPRLPAWQKSILSNMKKRVPKVPEMFWMLSSGTQSVSEVKAIGLSHAAVLSSAEAVNIHLRTTMKDRWLLTLPTFHVGGLGVLARAHLSGAKVDHLREWDAGSFVKKVRKAGITLTSLVPTQVFDIVQRGSEAPPSIRAVVVGGGTLDPDLYTQARELGWPILPSYGLTECASQVATADLVSLQHGVFPALKILPHAVVNLRDRRVFIQSDALCRWIAREDKHGVFTLEDPLRDGSFGTEDIGEWVGKHLRIHGRSDDIVKVLGELVPIPALEARARAFFRKRGLNGDLFILAAPGGRAGHRLVLVTDSEESLGSWANTMRLFNQTLGGPERLQQLCWVRDIPRSELGKVKKASLISDLRL